MNVPIIRWGALIMLLLCNENIECMQSDDYKKGISLPQVKPIIPTPRKLPEVEFNKKKEETKTTFFKYTEDQKNRLNKSNNAIVEWLTPIQQKFQPASPQYAAIGELISKYSKTPEQSKPITQKQPVLQPEAEKLKQKTFWSKQAEQKQQKDNLTDAAIVEWLQSVKKLYTPLTASHEAVEELITQYSQQTSKTTQQQAQLPQPLVEEQISVQQPTNSLPTPSAQTSLKEEYLAKFDEKKNPLKRAQEKIKYEVEGTPEYQALQAIIADYPQYHMQPIEQPQPTSTNDIKLIATGEDPDTAITFTREELKFSPVLQTMIEDYEKLSDASLSSFVVENITLKQLRLIKKLVASANQQATLFAELANYTAQELEEFLSKATFFDFTLFDKTTNENGEEAVKKLKIDQNIFVNIFDNLNNVTLPIISTLLRDHIDDKIDDKTKNDIIQKIVDYLETDPNALISYLFDNAKTNIVEIGERSVNSKGLYYNISLIDFSKKCALIKRNHFYLYDTQKNKHIYTIREPFFHPLARYSSSIEKMSPNGNTLILRPKGNSSLLIFSTALDKGKALVLPKETSIDYDSIQHYRFCSNTELELLIKTNTETSELIKFDLSNINWESNEAESATIIDKQIVNNTKIPFFSKSITDELIKKFEKIIENKNSNQTQYKLSESLTLHNPEFLIILHVEKKQQAFFFKSLFDDVYVIDLMPYFDSYCSPFKPMLYLLAHKITNWDNAYNDQINEMFDVKPKPKAQYQNPLRKIVSSQYEKIIKQAAEQTSLLKSATTEKIRSFADYVKNRAENFQSQAFIAKPQTGTKQPPKRASSEKLSSSENTSILTTVRYYFNRIKWW